MATLHHNWWGLSTAKAQSVGVQWEDGRNAWWGMRSGAEQRTLAWRGIDTTNVAVSSLSQLDC